MRKYSYFKIEFCLCISEIISKLLLMQEPTIHLNIVNFATPKLPAIF